MATRKLGIILHGATGGICSFQHLRNSLVPICAEGGIVFGNDTVQPNLLLIGRNADHLTTISKENGGLDWSTNLDSALINPTYSIFFDAATTFLRVGLIKKAIAAGKHIYTEKPLAPSVKDGLDLLCAAKAKSLKHGVVEDKLFLPGLRKLQHLVEKDFFGRILGFHIEFGWWVFDGIETDSQRPSWNYQKKKGGGLISDMHPHWRYIIEGILGPIDRIISLSWTGQTKRSDETGKYFDVDVEDNVHTLLELENGACGTIVSSWTTRVRRDDLFTFQVDGIKGSAIAGTRQCWKQASSDTPIFHGFRMGRDSDTMRTLIDYNKSWKEVPDFAPYKNPYRLGWENFIKHVVFDTPFYANFSAGIRDVELAEACQRSTEDGSWIDMKKL